jgi:hypothetical protein
VTDCQSVGELQHLDDIVADAAAPPKKNNQAQRKLELGLVPKMPLACGVLDAPGKHENALVRKNSHEAIHAYSPLVTRYAQRVQIRSSCQLSEPVVGSYALSPKGQAKHFHSPRLQGQQLLSLRRKNLPLLKS